MGYSRYGCLSRDSRQRPVVTVIGFPDEINHIVAVDLLMMLADKFLTAAVFQPGHHDLIGPIPPGREAIIITVAAGSGSALSPCFSFFLIHAMRRNPANKQKPYRYATQLFHAASCLSLVAWRISLVG